MHRDCILRPWSFDCDHGRAANPAQAAGKRPVDPGTTGRYSQPSSFCTASVLAQARTCYGSCGAAADRPEQAPKPLVSSARARRGRRSPISLASPTQSAGAIIVCDPTRSASMAIESGASRRGPPPRPEDGCGQPPAATATRHRDAHLALVARIVPHDVITSGPSRPAPEPARAR